MEPITTSIPRCVLIADDDPAIRFVLERALGRSGFRVLAFSNGQDLLTSALKGEGDLVITDIVMPTLSGLDFLKTIKTRRPTLPVIIITAQTTLLNAVTAFESGAFEYLPKPFDVNQLTELADRAIQKVPAKPESMSMEIDASRFGGIIGSSRAMQELFRTIGRMAFSEMTVLIHGESGVGKELVARAIHAYSPRAQGPFTAINMAAIPKELIESELFGHEKGAFTGAISRRAGHFEKSAEGTLFLDEIGDMPFEAQTRLLRVLQDGSFTSVGGTEIKKSNVRIIAATHQDLHAAIAAGRFREDLFFRLNVIPLFVPALRTRKEDIPLLAAYFLAETARELSIVAKTLSPKAIASLMNHDWPGNVRELENLMRRLTVLVPDTILQPEHLEDALYPAHTFRSSPEPTLEPIFFPMPEGDLLDEAIAQQLDRFFTALNGQEASNLYPLFMERVERPLFERVLREARGNQVKAARILGINRNTLRKKIRDLGIPAKI